MVSFPPPARIVLPSSDKRMTSAPGVPSTVRFESRTMIEYSSAGVRPGGVSAPTREAVMTIVT